MPPLISRSRTTVQGGPMRARGSLLNGGSFSSFEDFNPYGRQLMSGGMAGRVSSFNPSNPNGYQLTPTVSTTPDYFTELGTLRNQQNAVAQGSLDTFKNDLGSGLDAYGTQAGGLIDQFASGLNNSISQYRTASDADLLADEDERRRLRAQALRANRLAVQSAINSGTRNAKAMFAARGGGGSSYADRLAIGIRANAETDAANRAAEMERNDAMAIRDARRRRDAALFDAGRSDLASIYGDRSRLAGDMFSRQSNNLGTIYGEQSRLNTNNANLERDDLFRTRLITPTNEPVGPRQQTLVNGFPAALLTPRSRLFAGTF